jgi:hypothetical protein
MEIEMNSCVLSLAFHPENTDLLAVGSSPLYAFSLFSVASHFLLSVPFLRFIFGRNSSMGFVQTRNDVLLFAGRLLSPRIGQQTGMDSRHQG